MIKKITNWWNRREIALTEELNVQLTMLNEVTLATAKLSEQLDAAIEQARLVEETTAAERKANDHYTSVEPWVEIKSDKVDPIKGLVIELDWNDAFIQYLKENDITGRDPEAAVQKWVAMLYQNIVGELDEIAIQKSDDKRTGEFE